MVFLDQQMVDRHSGVVDRAVNDSERVGLRHPAVVIYGARPVAAAGSIDLVDRDDLARLRLGQQIVVLEAPPSRRIAAEGASGEGGIPGAARTHIDDSDFEDVARLGTADMNGAGAEMDAKSLACAPPVEGSVERPSAAPVDVLRLLRPMEDALGSRIARNHALMIVIGMVGQRLDRDEIAGIERGDRL